MTRRVGRFGQRNLRMRTRSAIQGARSWMRPIVLAGAGLCTALSVRAQEIHLEISPSVLPALTGSFSTKSDLSRRIDAHLLALQKEFQGYLAAGGRPALGSFRPHDSLLMVREDRLVAVDVTASADTASAVAVLQAFGCRNTTSYQRVTSAQCPIASIDRLAQETNINFVRAATAQVSAGLVTSQGDQSMRADAARATFGVTGSGITVGTLSDSYDCNSTAGTHAAADVAAGDLPAGVTVLADLAPGSGCTDEGRGMMQLIHDVAPGAAQAFHTGFGGLAVLANGILALRNTARADVIVDDITYSTEPMFQDGIIAQAADEVVQDGAAYFVAAGNFARDSYQGIYTPSGQFEQVYSGELHDFDPGAGVDVYQTITLPAGPAGVTTPITFQWDEPFYSVSGPPGSASDYDIWICLSDTQPVNATNCPVVGANANLGNDAVETITPRVTGPNGTTFTLYLAISRYSGTSRNLLKYIGLNSGMSIDEHDTSSSTSFGHQNSSGAETVGAAFYNRTPAFGQIPPLLEVFSSAGGTPIRFDTSGARIGSLTRPKPEIVAPDGGNTTFFGSDIALDADTFPNFLGTSAAAPHAAAVAALMLEASGGAGSLSPKVLYSALETSAIDMNTPGFDFDSGHGLIQADAAVAAVSSRDTDGDGVPDGADNCIDRPNGPLLPDAGGNSQRDTDGDGYGNACDTDISVPNDGITNGLDAAVLRAQFGTPGPEADFNGDGTVNNLDVGILRQYFGHPPGPSCCGGSTP